MIPFAGRNYINELKTHFRVVLLVGFLQTFCVYLLFFLALVRIKASTGAALIGIGPMIGAVLGHIFIKSDKFDKTKIVSFILGIVGVTFVSLGSGKGGGLPDSSEIAGIILFVLSSISGAFSNIIILKYKTDIRPGVLTSAQLTIGGIFLTLLSFAVYKENSLISFCMDIYSIFGSLFFGKSLDLIFPPGFYLSLIWLIFISSAGFSIWYYLLAKRRESLISMNIWKFIMPVTGGVLGWLIIPGDSPNVKTVSGMLVVASSILVFYKVQANKD